MKRPESIKIINERFDVVYNPNKSGATLSFEDSKMVIGTKYPNDVFDNLVHEISEALHIILGTRFEKTTNDSYVFLMDHSEFQLHNSILTSVLKEYII